MSQCSWREGFIVGDQKASNLTTLSHIRSLTSKELRDRIAAELCIEASLLDTVDVREHIDSVILSFIEESSVPPESKVLKTSAIKALTSRLLTENRGKRKKRTRKPWQTYPVQLLQIELTIRRKILRSQIPPNGPRAGLHKENRPKRHQSIA